MKNKAIRLMMSAPALALPALAHAHEGHGLSGAHWHATDLWGFVALGVAAAAAWWYLRRK